MKYLLLSVPVTVALSLGLLIEAQSSPPPAPRQAGADIQLIYAPGRIEGLTEEIDLRFQLEGRVAEILPLEGDIVSMGDPLVRLDDRQYACEVAVAEAELAVQRSSLERLLNGARLEERREAQAHFEAKLAEFNRAELTWGRSQRLAGRGAITDQQLDDDRLIASTLKNQVEAAKARCELLAAPARTDELKMAEARIAAAQANLNLAKLRFERAELRAPISGRVLKVNVDQGELTGPNSILPAVVMANTSRYRVRAFVEELDAPKVAIGMRAKFTADGIPHQTFSGCVTHISPRMSRKQIFSDEPTERFDTKVREIWIALEEATEMVVGLRVDVLIDTTARQPEPN